MPREEALAAIRSSVVKSYTRKGQDVVEKNFKVRVLSTVPSGRQAGFTTNVAEVHLLDYEELALSDDANECM